MAAPDPRKRKACDFSEPTVVVVVGEAQKEFALHPSILINNSKFFRSSFSGNWIESTSKRVTLPDTDPEIFQIYARYVYSGDIELPVAASDAIKQVHQTVQASYQALAKLFIVADMLDDKALRNAVMDKMAEVQTETPFCPNEIAIQIAFAGTPENSLLRRYLIDMSLSGVDPNCISTALPLLPSAFVNGLLLGWAAASSDKSIEYKPPADQPKCTYHEHDEETPMEEACAESFEEKLVTPKKPKKAAQNKRSRS